MAYSWTSYVAFGIFFNALIRAKPSTKLSFWVICIWENSCLHAEEQSAHLSSTSLTLYGLANKIAYKFATQDVLYASSLTHKHGRYTGFLVQLRKPMVDNPKLLFNDKLPTFYLLEARVFNQLVTDQYEEATASQLYH